MWNDNFTILSLRMSANGEAISEADVLNKLIVIRSTRGLVWFQIVQQVSTDSSTGDLSSRQHAHYMVQICGRRGEMTIENICRWN